MLDGCHRKCNVLIRILLVVNIICIYRSSIEKRTDYISNLIYKSGSLKRILVDGGYLENSVYHFYQELIMELLGNVVMSPSGPSLVVPILTYGEVFIYL